MKKAHIKEKLIITLDVYKAIQLKNRLNMKKYTTHIIKRLGIMALSLLVLLCATQDASAQRRRGNDGGGELKILKDLPDFFINDGFMPNKLKSIYRKDAARIALRFVDKEQKATNQTVEIPEQLVNAVYNALVAVRVSDVPAVDTVATKLGLRTFSNPNTNTITLIFEHDADWAKPLKMRADSTARYSINKIMRKYSLMVSKVVSLDEDRSGLVLISKEPVNIQALSRKFFLEEGIGCIEEIQPFGDGNDITMELGTDGWTITYSCKFGKCLEKCDKHYDWKFKVSRGGQVTYLGSKGDVIPPWIMNNDKKNNSGVVLEGEFNKKKTGASPNKGIENNKGIQDQNN